ncbi:MAG: 4-vinyl reductase [Deltaproteobacteria bacterium]|nr:4-vinyl reductase [Candidatus Zymogenaceae bacterium]
MGANRDDPFISFPPCKGPICFGEVGLDADVTIWATGDEHEVREVLCRAKGDDVCKIVISPEPKKIGLADR